MYTPVSFSHRVNCPEKITYFLPRLIDYRQGVLGAVGLNSLSSFTAPILPESVPSASQSLVCSLQPHLNAHVLVQAFSLPSRRAPCCPWSCKQFSRG